MCRQIKLDPDRPVRIVVMTALYTSVKYRTEALGYFRVDDYLTKPLEQARLCEEARGPCAEGRDRGPGAGGGRADARPARTLGRELLGALRQELSGEDWSVGEPWRPAEQAPPKPADIQVVDDDEESTGTLCRLLAAEGMAPRSERTAIGIRP